MTHSVTNKYTVAFINDEKDPRTTHKDNYLSIYINLLSDLISTKDQVGEKDLMTVFVTILSKWVDTSS